MAADAEPGANRTVTHPYDPDAPRTEEPPASRDDNETPRDERPEPTTQGEANASEPEPERPIYEPYRPGPRQEPPPYNNQPPPTYDPRPWDSMDDVAWPRRPEPEAAPPPPREEYHGWNPLIRLGVPQPWRGIIDWIVTIVGAIAIVLAIKAWVVNPYRIPSSSMEPTLHCGRGGSGCLARFSDRVLANRFIYHFRDPHRGEIIVFNVPKAAETACGSGGVFVKRIVGLPGDVWQEREGRVFINGKLLKESYIQKDRRDFQSYPARKIPKDNYFMMGDNRISSCDSRRWGTVPRNNIIGKVFAIYWPPQRIRLM
jgi:signal peptidase I